MTDKITLSALRRGDVLLFEGMDSDNISSTIMYLTNSRVSHAAMAYSEEKAGQVATLVHEASPKVPLSVRDAAKSFGDRLITVRRLPESRDGDGDELIAAADRYLREEAPYNNYGLYMVGVLLIYRKFIPDSRTSLIVAGILKLATKLIVHRLNKKGFPAKHPMTCSQFVAQCYDDAGGRYRLFDYDLLMNNEGVAEESESLSLLDMAIEAIEDSPLLAEPLDMTVPGQEMSEQEIAAQAQQLSGQLLNQLRQPPLDMAMPQSIDDELVRAIGEFSDSLYQAHYAGLDSAAANGVTGKLRWLKEQRNLFISPADLLRCARLDTVGTLRMK
ncbi:hypothetical protein TUM12370_12570 [Salmonella enterica subsp. enterica serovar Choleraesuis]|nr:hypothetical protein TUM12370_12570 [Salmonella enterica subsp. enterica serovar Choleraesuis]